MTPRQMEGYCDKSVKRATQNAEEHNNGKRDDRTTLTQCGAENTVCKALNTNINIRRQMFRENLVAAATAAAAA